MAESKQYIAVDLGAESGRVMLGTVSKERMTLEQCHRFANNPIEESGSLRWDMDMLLSEIKAGIGKAVRQSSVSVSGIAVDSWGVDFGLLDENGRLIENPYHYRDQLTDGIPQKAFELMPKRDIYENTGIQSMQINTVYRLLAMRLAGAKALSIAKNLVMTADLVAYHLTGRIFCEYSLASTTQMMDMKTGQWSKALCEKLNLPLEIMPEIVRAGTIVGHLKSELAEELGCEAIPVIATGSHDTACAVVGVPAETEGNWAYISSGTWSLMGIEIPKAIVDETTSEYQFTNEGGAYNTIRLLKNIMGLWLIQECRRYWAKEGDELTYAQLTEMAQKARPFAAGIDTDFHDFLSSGQMPEKINRHLRQSGQNTFDDKGQIVRIILESLAFKYRWVIDKLEEIRGEKIDLLHIVGGGIQNELLCQFTANAIGRKVITGPIEATACGNIIIQAIATGQIDSPQEGRDIIRRSYPLKEYQPEQTELWEKEYCKIRKAGLGLA